MCARHNDEHDLVGGTQLADTMDHEGVVDIEAPSRFRDDRFERPFGHPRIVLEGHRDDGRSVVDVAYRADERGDGAYAGVTGAQIRDLARDIEVFGLDADGHRFGTSYPPVTGGNSATSSPGCTGASRDVIA